MKLHCPETPEFNRKTFHLFILFFSINYVLWTYVSELLSLIWNCRYSEIQYYNFANPEASSGKIGHFTQVVWQATTKVGVGVATMPSEKYDHQTFVVAMYTPPGNVKPVSDYGLNVKPRKDGCTGTACKLFIGL